MCWSTFGPRLGRMRSVSSIRLRFVEPTRRNQADLFLTLLLDISLTSHCGYMRAAFIGKSNSLYLYFFVRIPEALRWTRRSFPPHCPLLPHMHLSRRTADQFPPPVPSFEQL